MRLSLAGAQDKLAVVAEADGTLHRLHQEDFCQALGYPDGLKYEASGGPGLAACAALVRKLALGPVAVQGLLDWVVFNVLIGNADAHAKNLSLLCDRVGQRRLAPLYDLVPTLYLPESLVERTPALRIGPARAHRLHAAIREVLAEAVNLGGSTLRDFASAHGHAGEFQQHAQVYGREGLPCRVCGTQVRMERQGQRSSFFCPRCQRP